MCVCKGEGRVSVGGCRSVRVYMYMLHVQYVYIYNVHVQCIHACIYICTCLFWCVDCHHLLVLFSTLIQLPSLSETATTPAQRVAAIAAQVKELPKFNYCTLIALVTHLRR